MRTTDGKVEYFFIKFLPLASSEDTGKKSAGELWASYITSFSSSTRIIIKGETSIETKYVMGPSSKMHKCMLYMLDLFSCLLSHYNSLPKLIHHLALL